MSCWLLSQAGEYYSAGLVRRNDGQLSLTVFDSNGDRVATETVGNVLPDQLATVTEVTTGSRGGSVAISVDNEQFFDSALTLAGSCQILTSGFLGKIDF